MAKDTVKEVTGGLGLMALFVVAIVSILTGAVMTRFFPNLERKLTGTNGGGVGMGDG